MDNTPKIAAAVGIAVGHGRAKAVGRTGRMIFSPGDTYAASEKHTAKKDERHAQVLDDLRRILKIANDGDYRTGGGRIIAEKLAKAYVKHPIFRAPLRERRIRELIPGWDQDGKLA